MRLLETHYDIIFIEWNKSLLYRTINGSESGNECVVAKKMVMNVE